MKLLTRGGASPWVTILKERGASKRFEIESQMDIFPARVYVSGVYVMADTIEVSDGDFGGWRAYRVSKGRKK
jgi:hypothetical protein